MNSAPGDKQPLAGGFAFDILTDAEKSALFEAALHDQELFNALTDEQALREMLADPAARAHIQRALENARSAAATAPRVITLPWYRRPLTWAATGAIAATMMLIAVIGQRGYPTVQQARVQQQAKVAKQAVPSTPTSTPPAEQDAIAKAPAAAVVSSGPKPQAKQEAAPLDKITVLPDTKQEVQVAADSARLAAPAAATSLQKTAEAAPQAAQQPPPPPQPALASQQTSAVVGRAENEKRKQTFASGVVGGAAAVTNGAAATNIGTPRVVEYRWLEGARLRVESAAAGTLYIFGVALDGTYSTLRSLMAEPGQSVEMDVPVVGLRSLVAVLSRQPDANLATPARQKLAIDTLRSQAAQTRRVVRADQLAPRFADANSVVVEIPLPNQR